jgi:hypothetical protein
MTSITIFVFEKRNWDIVVGYACSALKVNAIRAQLVAKALVRDVLWFKEITVEVTTTGGFNLTGAVNLEVEGI